MDYERWLLRQDTAVEQTAKKMGIRLTPLPTPEERLHEVVKIIERFLAQDATTVAQFRELELRLCDTPRLIRGAARELIVPLPPEEDL